MKNKTIKTLYVQLGALFLIISGVFLMWYSLYEHYQDANKKAFCDLSEVINCSLVNKGPYSEFLGVPVAMWGLLFFVVLLLGFLFYLINYKQTLLSFLYYFSWLGLLIALFLFMLVFYKLKAICPVCVATDFVIVLLVYLFYFLKKVS